MSLELETSSLTNPEEMSAFAKTIMDQKYAHTLPNGAKETWAQIAHRVATNVMSAVGASRDLTREVEHLIAQRKFIPGGRYLYAAGRPFHQVQNCFDGSTEIITRSGNHTLESLVGKSVEVLNKDGEWEKAEVRCFGEQEIFEMTLENGVTFRTTEGHLWIQPDGSRVKTIEAQEVMLMKPAPIEASVEGIRHGIIFGDGHLVKGRYSQVCLIGKKQELSKYFVDEERAIVVGCGAQISVRTIRDRKLDRVVSLQPKEWKSLPVNPTPEYARGFIAGLIATDGCVPEGGSVSISCEGFEKAKEIAKIASLGGCVVTSVRVSSRVSPFDGSPRELSEVRMKPYSVPAIRSDQVERLSSRNLRKNFLNTIGVASVKATGVFEPVFCVVAPRTNTFTLAEGITTSNCLLLKAEDSREGWADLMQKSTMALMTGAGIGIDYSNVRAEGRLIRKTGGVATGPIALMQMVNEAGRGIMQGGSRRSAIWAGLNWKHPDAHKFITLKNWIPEVRDLKARDFNFPATMDGTNISVLLDDEFFAAYHDESHAHHSLARGVYSAAIRQMLKTGEPGFSVDVGHNSGESLRNACCEISSRDDSDICNLGSINLARIESLDEMKRVTEVATAFLLAGTVYSDVPYSLVDRVRTKNRRLGLGLMGIHEWLLKRGKRFGGDPELDQYLAVYATSTQIAKNYADAWDLSAPVKTRAIAPTGTIGIIAETSTGIEPIFCVAYKRRYAKGSLWNYQYVIDPTAKRLIDQGVSPDQIEDAYTLAQDLGERRIAFQAHLQSYVDHAISSTLNLPAWGSQENNEATAQAFGDMLMKYLPRLRGITVYPDGARGGQPLNPVSYKTASKHVGEIFVEQADVCDITKGGSCGA